MLATKGMNNVLLFYKYFAWLYPVFRPVFPGFMGTLSEVGLAMINCVRIGYEKRILEVKDIRVLAEKQAFI
jgi:hypothetical protein